MPPLAERLSARYGRAEEDGMAAPKTRLDKLVKLRDQSEDTALTHLAGAAEVMRRIADRKRAELVKEEDKRERKMLDELSVLRFGTREAG